MSNYEKINEDTTDSYEKRENTLHLKGVDNLATYDIKEYIQRYISDLEFKVEWINDSSLNIVFEDEKSALKSLIDLTSASEDKSLDSTVERRAQVFDNLKPEIDFVIRIANTSDKKVKNAAIYSRYYLLNPEEQSKYRRDNINYKNRDLRSEFREREQRRKRTAIEADDLFPSLLKKSESRDKSQSLKDVDMKETSVLFGENDLFSRIKPKVNDSEDLFSRIKAKP